LHRDFDFDAGAAYTALSAMELPIPTDETKSPFRLRIKHPGGVGEILHDADGGSWLRGIILEPEKNASIKSSELQFVAIV